MQPGYSMSSRMVPEKILVYNDKLNWDHFNKLVYLNNNIILYFGIDFNEIEYEYPYHSDSNHNVICYKPNYKQLRVIDIFDTYKNPGSFFYILDLMNAIVNGKSAITAEDMAVLNAAYKLLQQKIIEKAVDSKQ